MKAAALSSFGGPDVLRLQDIDDPTAGPGEVRVRVKAAGVQPFDTAIRRGWTPPFLATRPPVVPGNEFAGVVDQVGDRVTGVEVGAEVLGFSTLGGYAEYVVVPEDQIVAKPKDMPWEIAGGFSGNAQGAHLALQAMGVGKGDTVLIHAAAGALGTLAVQLARAWGADRVIGTASEANHEYLRKLGAVPVTYGEGLVERVRAVAPEGVDAALDAAGPEALRASVELVKDRSRIRTMLSLEEAKELGIPLLGPGRSASRLASLVDLYARGQLTVHLRATYALADAAEAHRDIERGHGRGKIVIIVDATA
ncbi:NADPH:quinone reductase-like Zn-dependent oxidoreductase [Krasilnikovia cinnamomea]|uniref:NADPH:quinone reductase-like Zn-dependent oxidoreductase n=1 Tax=Krasilnikovia cinnamomea TaxID=349313 RepID=A0A4Q7ZMQ7_9ACTN|nr:NADP-dependent oxidoreductase [Krasilnikovia cinnamomea]RZU51645.1 NADPH:quinone reductase-like Zn-dependent oxidoreductase [Krasilnikovia cinnamomea]